MGGKAAGGVAFEAGQLGLFGLVPVCTPRVRDPLTAVIAGIAPGYHSRWAGQSDRDDVPPGRLVDLAVRLRNAGDQPWVRGAPGRQATLGSNGPLDNTRDFDRGIIVSPLGSPNRFATTTEAVVKPGEIGTFAMRVRAPGADGIYKLSVRPVVDGVTWMEDEGIFFLLRVRTGAFGDCSSLLPPAVISVDESIGVADSVSVRPPAVISVDESIGVADGVGVFPPLPIQVDESIGVGDGVSVRPPAAITVDEAVGVLDGVSVLPPLPVQVVEGVTIDDGLGLVPSPVVGVTEEVTAGDGVTVVPSPRVGPGEAVSVEDSVSIVVSNPAPNPAGASRATAPGASLPLPYEDDPAATDGIAR